MPKKHKKDNYGQTKDLQSGANTLLSYPVQGVNIGMGRHITPTPTTINHGNERQHPVVTDDYAYPVDQQLEDGLDDPVKRAKVNPAILNKLDNARATAEILTPDWEWSEM